MENQLQEIKSIFSDKEFEIVNNLYTKLMYEQGVGVSFIKELQIIDFCVCYIMTYRAMQREIEINQSITHNKAVGSELKNKKDKESCENKKACLYDEIDENDIALANLLDQLKDIKNKQVTYLQIKEQLLKDLG